MPSGNSEFIICVILKLNTTLQSQKAVTAYWKSKQLLPFAFAPSLRKVSEKILLLKGLRRMASIFFFFVLYKAVYPTDHDFN